MFLKKIYKIYSYELPGPDACALKFSADLDCKTDELSLAVCSAKMYLGGRGEMPIFKSPQGVMDAFQEA